MSTRLTATTRYGDLIGTVEIDGHDRPPLDDLARLTNMPANYCPIGIEISLFASFDGAVGFALLAYDSNKVGCSPDEMRAFVRQHGNLPIRRFSGTLRPATAHRYFNRCSIVAVDSRTADVGDKLRVEDESADNSSDSNRGLARSKPR